MCTRGKPLSGRLHVGDVPLSFEPLQVFDKYEVIRRLAMGGMGEIFLARQKGVAGFDRLAILKSLLPDLAKDKELVGQFLDEARIAANLNHPNIVGIYELGEWEGVYFLAMEYIKGESFADLARAAREHEVGVPWHVSVRLVRDTALGLDHAHHATDAAGTPLNIIHRDVTPQNIMVRLDGVVKVLDFGIAKSAASASRTSAGEVKGKLQYMAPEQIRGEPFDHRSDQFALGVVLWEMATGRRLFPGASPVEIFRNILTHNVPKPSSFIPGFPADLEEIVLKMLMDKPDDRYSRCKEAATALSGWLETHNAPADGVAKFVEEHVGEEVRKRADKLDPVPTVIQGIDLDKNRCGACGHRNKEGTKFCAECGTNLDGTATPSATPVPPAAVPTPAMGFQPPPHTGVGFQPPPHTGAGFQPPPTTAVNPGTPTSTPSSPPRDVDLDEIFGAEPAPSPMLRKEVLLFGRDSEQALVTSMLAAGDDAVRAVSFVGDRGIGKSQLLAWTRQQGKDAGWVVASAQGNAYGESAHLDVVRQLLRSVVAHRTQKAPHEVDSPDVLDHVELDALWLRRVKHVLLGEADHGLIGDDDLDHLALAHLLKAAAGEDRLLIVVDDLDLADRISQKVLGRLVDVMGRAQVAVVTAGKGEARLPQAKHQVLAPLDDDSVLQLLRERFGHGGVPRTGAPRILETTRGNPAFAVELMGYLVEKHLIAPVQGTFMADEGFAAAKLPQSVNFLITSRFRALDMNARKLLLIAAVSGQTFNLDVVLWGAGLGQEVDGALQDARDARFLKDKTDDDEAYGFTCATVREVILGLSYAAEVQKAHQSLASALRQQYVEDKDIVIVDQMARHTLAGDPANAEDVLLKAVALMRSHGDSAGPAAYYPALLSLRLDAVQRKQRAAEVDEALVAPVLQLAIDAAKAMKDEPLDAVHLVSRCLKAVPNTMCPALRVELMQQQAKLRTAAKQFADAENVLDEALELPVELTGLQRAGLLADLAEVMHAAGNHDGARMQLIEALRSVPQHELTPAFLYERMLLLGTLSLRLGDKTQAKGALLKAQAFAEQGADVDGRLKVIAKLADVEAASGNPSAAQEALTAGIRLSRECGALRQNVQMQVKQAQYLLVQGKGEEARWAFESARNGAEMVGWTEGLASIDRALTSLPAQL